MKKKEIGPETFKQLEKFQREIIVQKNEHLVIIGQRVERVEILIKNDTTSSSHHLAVYPLNIIFFSDKNRSLLVDEKTADCLGRASAPLLFLFIFEVLCNNRWLDNEGTCPSLTVFLLAIISSIDC